MMDQVRNFGDLRQTSFCVYCGRDTETRDHVPSKVFLDEPYPTNLPVVSACQLCNEGSSLDEEYVACLIECSLTGSFGPDGVIREKIKRILRRKPTLVTKFFQASIEMVSGLSFDIETERVGNLVLKLARGHAAFELNEPQLDNPSSIIFLPLQSMTPEIRHDFETPPRSLITPEVGSRASQRLVVDDPGASLWIIVQPGRYRYLTSVADRVTIRFVISEYMSCEVTWNRNL